MSARLVGSRLPQDAQATARFIAAWNDGVPLPGLARRFGISTSSCNGLVRRLRARGHILLPRGGFGSVTRD